MNLDDLLKQPANWLEANGESPIVLSSRVRLARNLAGFPFTHWSTPEQREAVGKQIIAACQNSPYFKTALFIDMDEISDLDKQLLVERHLISLEHAEPDGRKFVVVGEGETLSLMVNEEDHIRMQMLQPGLRLLDTWHIIDRVDSALAEELEYAYSDKLGYLTACPTNVGTGMRASVMMHLPALVMTKQIGKVLQAIAKLGLAARGLYGEGTLPSGNFFQVSNQITLGQSEEQIIDNIERIAMQIASHERSAREIIFERRRYELEDRVFRAYGILKNARVISSQEAMNLLSDLRLGVDMGLIQGVSRSVLNELCIITQPAHIQKIAGMELPAEERDIRRATMIRERLR